MVKVGIRKPNLKSSLKARTTGRAKRAVKRAVIPGYGRKGMGWIKDPKKAAYNVVYSRTTVGLGDIARVAVAAGKPGKSAPAVPVPSEEAAPSEEKVVSIEPTDENIRHVTTALLLCIFLGYAGAHRFYARMWPSGVLYLCTFGVLSIGWIRDIVRLARVRSMLVSLRRGGVTETE